jgi:hypothetical protein
MTTPEPGIYFDIPFDEYRQWPAVNNSSISYGQRSMLHYREQPDRPTTDAMRFGSFVHSICLERHRLHQEYVPEPDLTAKCLKPDGTPYANPKATKKYKELMAEYRELTGDKQLVPSDWFDTAQGMLAAIDAHPIANELLLPPGNPEVSIVWDDAETGLRCKARIDWLRYDNATNELTAVDLKTTQDASDFERSIAKFAYHRQAAFYLDGLAERYDWEAIRGCAFWFVAVEKEPPYGVRAAPMSQDAIRLGRTQYREFLHKLKECRRTGVYPGYDSPDEWQLPAWAYPKQDRDEPIGISINGEIVI